MVGEGKWHLVPSYEDATILIRNYEINTVTKFSYFSSDKDFGRIGMHLITIIYSHMEVNSYCNNSSAYCNIINKIYKLF